MFQFPNRSGMSRHGAPVRNRHAVASTTVCRSTGGRPVDFAEGNNGPITAHASSEITSRDTRVGILAAALYSPVFTTAVTGAGPFCLAVVCFVLLVSWKLPPWVVVIVGAVGGVLLGAL